MHQKDLEIKVKKKFQIYTFKNVKSFMKHIKEIKFKETYIIVNGSLMPEFIKKFRDNITDIA